MTTVTEARFAVTSMAHRRPLLRSACGLMLFTVLLGVAASWGPPLDDHELLVAQIAREMRQRGDWVVPVFNQIPRLNKPPLSPWLAMAASYMDPWASGVEGRHARVASVLSGAALVGFTIYVGIKRCGRRAGLWAGALAATTTGMLHFIYSARPEMLYAALCAAGLAAFVAAEDSPRRSRRGLVWALALWTAWGLATLAKGPQMPALFLLGIVVYFAWRRVPWRQGLGLLRPWLGLPLYLAVVLPWWLCLIHRVGYATFSQSQLAGRRFGLSPANLLDLSGLLKTFGLLVPWLLLLLPAARVLWRRRASGRGLALAAAISLVGIVGLGFARGQRGYYALPLLPLFAVLLSVGLRRVLALARLRPPWTARLRVIALVHVLAVAVVLAVFAILAPGYARVVLFLGALGVPACWALVDRWPSPVQPVRRLARATVAAMGLAMLVLALGARGWNPEPFERAAFARQVAALVPADRPLYSNTDRCNVVVFHGRRWVSRLAAGPLADALAAAGVTEGYAIVVARILPTLPANVHATVLLTVEADDPDDGLALVHLSLIRS